MYISFCTTHFCSASVDVPDSTNAAESRDQPAGLERCTRLLLLGRRRGSGIAVSASLAGAIMIFIVCQGWRGKPGTTIKVALSDL